MMLDKECTRILKDISLGNIFGREEKGYTLVQGGVTAAQISALIADGLVERGRTKMYGKFGLFSYALTIAGRMALKEVETVTADVSQIVENAVMVRRWRVAN